MNNSKKNKKIDLKALASEPYQWSQEEVDQWEHHLRKSLFEQECKKERFREMYYNGNTFFTTDEGKEIHLCDECCQPISDYSWAIKGPDWYLHERCIAKLKVSKDHKPFANLVPRKTIRGKKKKVKEERRAIKKGQMTLF